MAVLRKKNQGLEDALAKHTVDSTVWDQNNTLLSSNGDLENSNKRLVSEISDLKGTLLKLEDENANLKSTYAAKINALTQTNQLRVMTIEIFCYNSFLSYNIVRPKEILYKIHPV